MKNKIRILVSNTTDPYFNLATEAWIFNNSVPGQQILFLWRNQPTVVIGRSQNPWVECHLEKMKADGVNIVRRHSGGGAVYHDLGNSIFTFISPLESYDKKINNQIVLEALKTFGISAEASGRNDLIVMHEGFPKKFSGSGFKQTKDRALHHGTVLLRTDLNRLQDYLSPKPGKLIAKGIASVASRVINLAELNPVVHHDAFCNALIHSFREHYQASLDVEILDHAMLAPIPSLNESYEQLKSWDWIYGKTMEFSHQLDAQLSWGNVDVNLLVEDGVIREAAIYSDSLFPDLVSALADSLKGARYVASDLRGAICGVGVQHSEWLLYVNEFSECLLQQL